MKNQRGFTLIELLIALTVMAVMAGLSWRGIDGLLRTREATQQRVDQAAVLQTVLAQWSADLDAMQAVPGISEAGVQWDGQVLRIMRRSSAWRGDARDPGMWVVAWTRQGTSPGQWVRWQSPALTERTALEQAWQQAARWGQNPSSEDLARQTLLTPLEQWQLVYFRGNAWTNPLSSAAVTASPSEAATAGAPSVGNSTPDAIRLLLDLPASTGLGGRLTLDWVRPNFSNTKS